MPEKSRAHLAYKAYRCLRRKILCGYRKGKTDRSEKHEKKAHFYYKGLVTRSNTVVDDRRDYKRHDKLERSLKELEKRAEHSLFRIALKIFYESFHF